jgi:hypothetical protein
MNNRSCTRLLAKAAALARCARAGLRFFLQPHAPSRERARNHAAEAKATELLVRLLDSRQRREFERHGFFPVTVAGRGEFVILPSRFFNVLHVATGDCYCAVPRGDVPLPDLMLSQKLVLENDPERFFRVANRRHELTVVPAEESCLPERVMSTRVAPRRSQLSWRDISLMPS